MLVPDASCVKLGLVVPRVDDGVSEGVMEGVGEGVRRGWVGEGVGVRVVHAYI